MSLLLHKKFIRTTVTIPITLDHNVIVGVRVGTEGKADGLFSALHLGFYLILNSIVSNYGCTKTRRWFSQDDSRPESLSRRFDLEEISVLICGYQPPDRRSHPDQIGTGYLVVGFPLVVPYVGTRPRVRGSLVLPGKCKVYEGLILCLHYKWQDENTAT